MVNLKRIAKRLEKAFAEEKAKECEDLHNAIAEVLKEKKATIQNILFVFDIIKFELLRAKYEQILGHVIIPKGSVPIKKDAKLTTGEAK